MNRRRKPKTTEASLKAREEHREFLRSMGIDPLHKIERGPLQAEDRERKKLPPLSNGVGNGYVKSVDDWKWKNRKETAETIKEIEAKKKRVAPAYNKGASQYITPGTDTTTLGRKV